MCVFSPVQEKSKTEQCQLHSSIIVEHGREKESAIIMCVFSSVLACVSGYIFVCISNVLACVCVHQGVHICVTVSMCRQGVGVSCVLVCQSISQFYFMSNHIEVILDKKYNNKNI